MNNLRSVPLGDVCTVVAGQHIEACLYSNQPVGSPYLTGPADFGDRIPVVSKWTESPKVFGRATDVFLTVKGAGVGKSNLGCDAAIGRQLMALRPKPEFLLQAFLFHFIRLRENAIGNLAQGATVPGIGKGDVEGLQIPLPTLLEQSRIAAILDQAEALRAKRRAALAKLDPLAQSIFFEMFGDPQSNSRRWPTAPLIDLLRIPLRNGLSPSEAGAVAGRVLTLSAITRGAFDCSAWKEARFHTSPPSDQVVEVEDLLICRGNGNADLVGRGHFPTEAMPGVLFPDTMIAARVDTNRWPKRFVEFVWNSPSIRQQIDRLVRTTNGTYKVNQGMLEKVLLPNPPHPMQVEFSSRLEAIAKLRLRLGFSSSHLDALFSALQHRAFRGEL